MVSTWYMKCIFGTSNLGLGKHVRTKTDEFLEKFQTAFDPPPSFSENHVADFLNSCTALKTIHVVYFWKALGTRVSKIMIPAVKYKVSTSNSGVSPRQSQERHWKPYGNSPNRACLYIASLLFAAQFYEMPGHRHRINRVINVQVNTLFTETFPTMVNLELPNFHKWSRLIVARDTFTTIPPVYFGLFAKFSQMCQVDCCWVLGCPRKTFFEISL